MAEIRDTQKLIELLVQMAEPFRHILYSPEAAKADFGDEMSVETPIGTAYLDERVFAKLLGKGRNDYFGLIKPTFESPLLVINHTDSERKNREIFVKTFLKENGRAVYFVSITKNEEGKIEMVSGHEKKPNQIMNKIREGSVTYQYDTIYTAQVLSGFQSPAESTALSAPKQTPPNHTTLEFGFPYTLKRKNNAKVINPPKKMSLSKLPISDRALDELYALFSPLATAEALKNAFPPASKREAKPLSGRKKVSFSHKGTDYSFETFPKADTTVYEGYKDIDDLKKKVNVWLKNNLRNKSFKNEHTGWEIVVNDDGIGKMFSEGRGEGKFKALTALEDIIKSATWVKQDIDRKGTDKIECYHYFMSVVEIEGSFYPFGFTAKQIKGEKFVYSGIFIPIPLLPN